MSSSFFLKCENCENKPATIRLYNGAQERKVCFQCERDLVAKPQFKEWNKQFIPYSDLKKNGPPEPQQLDQSRHSNISSISKVDSGLRSPTPVSSSFIQHKPHLSSSYRDKSEKMNDSFLAKSPSSNIAPLQRTPRALETVSPKIGIGKRSHDITKPTIETEPNKIPTGIIRPNTPKKNGFYSDYLQDYNPKSMSFKSPTAGALKREITDRASRSYSSTSFINPMLSGRTSNRQPEKGRNSSTYGTYETGRTSSRPDPVEPQRREASAVRNAQVSDIKIPVETAPDQKFTTDETERRARDAKRDDIRSRISRLNEQFYSPIKSPVVGGENKLLNTDETTLSIDFRDNKLFNAKKDYSGIQRDSAERLSLRNNSVEDEHPRAVRKGEDTNEDYKHKLSVQGYESTIANLKSHLDSVERRNGETITKLREEIRHLREELLKERTTGGVSSNKEVSNLQGNVSELEKRLEEQQNKYKSLEERSEQTKANSDKRLAELKEEFERTKKEKDRRIEDLNNQIKSLNKSHKEAVELNHRENENFIKKLKNEYDLISKDLNKQVDYKTQEIERLKQEKEESTRSNNARVATLQESLKHHQEINNQLRLDTRGDDGQGSHRARYNPRGGVETPIKDTS